MKRITKNYYHHMYRKYVNYYEQPVRKPEKIKLYSIDFDKDVYQLFK